MEERHDEANHEAVPEPPAGLAAVLRAGARLAAGLALGFGALRGDAAPFPLDAAAPAAAPFFCGPEADAASPSASAPAPGWVIAKAAS